MNRISEMSPEPPPLAYALPDAVDARFERTRRLFAWFTLGTAVFGAITGGAMGFSYWRITQLGPQRFILPVALLLTAAPLAIGAILMLRGREAGAIVIRWSAFALWAAGVSGSVSRYYLNGFAVPTTAFEVGSLLGAVLFSLVASTFTLPSLLFCLSFPLRRGTR